MDLFTFLNGRSRQKLTEGGVLYIRRKMWSVAGLLLGYLHFYHKKKKFCTTLPGLYCYSWFIPLRNIYTIKPRFCFHIAEFVMCRQPHQKSGCKQPRTSTRTSPFTERAPEEGGAPRCRWVLGGAPSPQGSRLGTRGDWWRRANKETLRFSFALPKPKRQDSMSVSSTFRKRGG